MSLSIVTRQAYAEIDTFLDLLDEYYRNKIPPKLREYFKKEKDVNYIKNINPNQPIKEQNLKEETLALIAMLNLQYWCEDENEKKELKRIYEENEKKYQIKLREKYNPDNIFKNKPKNIQVNQPQQTAMIEYKEDSLLKRIKKLIWKFLNRK